ncbi:SEA domain-containing protein, partial [Trichonephila clavata]
EMPGVDRVAAHFRIMNRQFVSELEDYNSKEHIQLVGELKHSLDVLFMDSPLINFYNTSDNSNLREAIIRYSLANKVVCDWVANSVIYMLDAGEIGFHDFGYDLVANLFHKYPFEKFIAICSFISYVAHVFFRVVNELYMDKSCFLIAVLFFKMKRSFITAGGWEEFRKFCMHLVADELDWPQIRAVSLKSLVGFYPRKTYAYPKWIEDRNRRLTYSSL